MIQKVKRAWARVPSRVRTEAKHVAVLFVVTFVVSAKQGLPQVLSTPSVSTVKAVVIAAAGAAVRSLIPVVIAFSSHYWGKAVTWAAAQQKAA